MEFPTKESSSDEMYSLGSPVSSPINSDDIEYNEDSDNITVVHLYSLEQDAFQGILEEEKEAHTTSTEEESSVETDDDSPTASISDAKLLTDPTALPDSLVVFDPTLPYHSLSTIFNTTALSTLHVSTLAAATLGGSSSVLPGRGRSIHHQ
ncbi:hypothetical protein GOP47_0013579 [Adiantum capillus-veneris]|uniref:Uncharacterized protein n=1 Tax=Adiantum capillus-veneris TaxID=13818 RepID=A0A9D4UQ15_ADICA|nr:hypothetical protein GOP47_0013579 [Adiantum capillus-veneris]